jgi:hypothetical protein
MGAGAPRLPAEWLGFFRFDFNVEPAGIVSQITFVETRIAFLWAITVVTFSVLTAIWAPCVVPRIVLDQAMAVWVFTKPHFFLGRKLFSAFASRASLMQSLRSSAQSSNA